MKACYKADKTCLRALRIIVLAFTTVIVSVISYFLVFIPYVMLGICLTFVLIGLFFSFIYLPIYFDNMEYTVTDKKIIKKSGFYFIKNQTVDVDKIQYVSAYSTPFDKFTGLNLIILYAYGGTLSIMCVSEKAFSEITHSVKN